MPQQDMSSRLGKSSSPVAQRVIQNSENVQRVVPTSEATKASVQFNKKPVKP